jgi:hypothetical protein
MYASRSIRENNGASSPGRVLHKNSVESSINAFEVDSVLESNCGAHNDHFLKRRGRNRWVAPALAVEGVPVGAACFDGLGVYYE